MECQGDDRKIEFDSKSQKALIGSTCTLIFEKVFHLDPNLIDHNMATLLMGVIAIDTLNMDESAGKGTPRDLVALTGDKHEYFDLFTQST